MEPGEPVSTSPHHAAFPTPRDGARRTGLHFAASRSMIPFMLVKLIHPARQVAHRLRLNEVGPLLSLLALAVCGWAFLALADYVTEGETHEWDRAIMLALRDPAEHGRSPRTGMAGGSGARRDGAGRHGDPPHGHARLDRLSPDGGQARGGGAGLRHRGRRPPPVQPPQGSSSTGPARTWWPTRCGSTRQASRAVTPCCPQWSTSPLARFSIRIVERRRIKVFFMGLAIVLTMLIGTSRVYLGRPLAERRPGGLVRGRGLGVPVLVRRPAPAARGAGGSARSRRGPVERSMMRAFGERPRSEPDGTGPTTRAAAAQGDAGLSAAGGSRLSRALRLLGREPAPGAAPKSGEALPPARRGSIRIPGGDRRGGGHEPARGPPRRHPLRRGAGRLPAPPGAPPAPFRPSSPPRAWTARSSRPPSMRVTRTRKPPPTPWRVAGGSVRSGPASAPHFRDKDMAVLARAGFSYGIARRVIDGESPEG